MKENTKKWALRILLAAEALFFFAFGLIVEKTGFCLGDVILDAMGLPVWTAGTRNSTPLAVFGALTCFYYFARTTKDPKQTMQTLVFGSVGLVMVVTSVLNML